MGGSGARPCNASRWLRATLSPAGERDGGGGTPPSRTVSSYRSRSVGTGVGSFVGCSVGLALGIAVVGTGVGTGAGCVVGSVVGISVGFGVGDGIGFAVGSVDRVGAVVGFVKGDAVEHDTIRSNAPVMSRPISWPLAVPHGRRR